MSGQYHPRRHFTESPFLGLFCLPPLFTRDVTRPSAHSVFNLKYTLDHDHSKVAMHYVKPLDLLHSCQLLCYFHMLVLLMPKLKFGLLTNTIGLPVFSFIAINLYFWYCFTHFFVYNSCIKNDHRCNCTLLMYVPLCIYWHLWAW